VIDDAVAQSRVSAEAAKAWADAQEISPAARARLKKQGYAPDQVRADAAEFYRITGGRLATFKIRSIGSKRASAEGIHGHGTSVINIDGNFTKKTLWHELGHHLERDPVVFAAARGFLERRRESIETHSLRSLTGNKGYRSNEVAYKDSWFSPYVGKHYSYDVTEVMSMGIESYCGAETLADRVSTDPEHMAMIMGFIRTPPDELFGGAKKVFAQLAEADAEVKQDGDALRAESIRRLAAGVTIDPPSGDTQGRLAPMPWGIESAKPTLIGTYGKVRIYSCEKLKDPWTRRPKKGHALIRSDNWLYPTSVFGDMDEVKAVAAMMNRLEDPRGNVALSDPQALKQWADRIEAGQAAAT